MYKIERRGDPKIVFYDGPQILGHALRLGDWRYGNKQNYANVIHL